MVNQKDLPLTVKVKVTIKRGKSGIKWKVEDSDMQAAIKEELERRMKVIGELGRILGKHVEAHE